MVSLKVRVHYALNPVPKFCRNSGQPRVSNLLKLPSLSAMPFSNLWEDVVANIRRNGMGKWKI